ncbi:MAG: aminoglycoside adenylyltransferase domain-containing protein [Armatimonadota bacterium]
MGVYLYGSLARGCYHPSTSDIDILAITRLPCPEDAIHAILKVHQESGLQIDAVFATEDRLCADVYPVPVDFLVKPISGYTVFRKTEESEDFLLQREDTYEAGINLIGPIPRELIRPVPWKLLSQSLDFLFPHIIMHFKNPALMLCRIVYAWKHRKLCSKQQAGEWALGAFDSHWTELIQSSLDQYAGGFKTHSPIDRQLHDYEAYCAEYLRTSRWEAVKMEKVDI